MNKRYWASALATAFFGISAIPAAASDQAVFGTMAACRAANVPLANTMTRLEQLGWQQVTRRSNRTKIAAHMAAGVHHTLRGFDRSDYRSMQSYLLKNAGRSTRTRGKATSQLTIAYYTLGGSLNHQLVLWDDVSNVPGRETNWHARKCYIVTPSHQSVKAFEALAEPVRHLGFRRMKGQWIDPRVRRYWVSATHRSYPKSGLPFRPTSTDFIRIEAQTSGSN